MPNRYYAALESGDSWTGATLHTDRDCTDEHLTPLRADAIDADECELCPDCAGNGSDSGGGGDDEPATCDVVKNDDEVCGRERPCPYHD